MNTPFNPALIERWAGWVAVILLVWVLVMLLLLLLLRLYRRWADPRREALISRLRAGLFEVALAGGDWIDFGTLGRSARWELLQLWLHVQMSLRGRCNERLRQMGRDLNLEHEAMTHLNSPHHARRMIAMLALGYLQSDRAVERLRARMRQGHSHSVIHAGRALLEKDAELHAPEVMQSLLHHPDLDLSLSAVMFKPHRCALQSAMLKGRDLTDPAPWEDSTDQVPLTRWLHLARALQLQLPSDWLSPLLQSDQDIEGLIAAIRLFQGERGIQPVLHLADHPDWRVRAQVARSLFYVGDVNALQTLVRMTTDREWWVRFRSAQALLGLPGVPCDRISVMVAQTHDKFAIQMFEALRSAGGRA